ncbi:MAG: GTPase Era [Deltaproteobacteria bacterium]|nr:GTPase Era [Deltaproteobacteria bacterium]
MAESRAGFVALLGPPNVGKSSLLNALLGQRLAIVSPRPQTTRSRILGILPRGDAQILFLDTPGRHDGTKTLNATLNAIVDEAARDCDVALLLVDSTRGWSGIHDELLRALSSKSAALVVVETKTDLPAARTGLPIPEALASGVVRVSARRKTGLEALLDAIVAKLPASPPLYGEDELTDRPVRWLCAELIREAAMRLLDEELPHSIAVQLHSYEESDPRLVRICADLLVERESQKRIVVGQGGRQIKQIGIRAREAIEAFIERRVHLELFVKVDPRWSQSARRMAELGYH